MKNEKQMILNDNLWKLCLKLSLPAIIAMVLYGFNVVIDGIFVGRFVGESALAGVSNVYPLTQFALGFGSMIGVGAGSVLSILIGENNLARQKRLLGNVNTIILILSILVIILGFVFLDPLLRFMGTAAENYSYAKDYFSLTLMGSIFWIAGLAYNMIVRAEGKMKAAAIMMGIGLCSNIAFNYLFMVTFNLGVKGAAIGTNIGMSIYVILFFIYCGKGKASFETNEYKLYFDKNTIKEIISLGVPSLLMSIMSVIQGIIIMNALNSYGSTADVAFYGIVFRLFNLFLTPIFGLMRALQPVAGVNFGAKQYDRVISSYKVFTTLAFIIILPIYLLSLLFSQELLGLMLPLANFSKTDLNYFRIFISTAPFLCVAFTAMTFWPAIKKPMPAMLLGVGRQLLLYIPLMIILPKFFGIAAIYYGSFAIDMFVIILTAIVILRTFRSLRSMN